MWQIISGYIGVFIMFCTIYIFGKLILSPKMDFNINIRKIIIIIFIFSFPQTVIFLKLTGMGKTSLMTIINVLFFTKAFKLNYKKSILMSTIYTIFFVICDFIEMYFVTKVIGISMEYCFNTFAGSIVSTIIVCILFLILTVIFKNPIKKILELEVDNNKKIIFISILTLLSIIIFFYEMGREFRINSNFWIYIFVIAVLVSVLLNYIKQAIINNKIQNDYDKLLEFMKTYEEEIENQRTLRHETKNEFLAIRSKICDKEKEKAIIDYIDEILGDTYSVKNEKYAKFGYLPANGVKGLCYFKTQKAEEQGISVSINISKKIQSSTICNLNTKEQRDFAKILGVFIDNAIEASAESKDKELGIEAYSNLNNEFRMIISNTYNNEIDEEKIGKENFTTKGKNRGHGLLLVNQLVQKNNIFDTKREIKNNIYSQTIIVKNRQK